MTLSDGRSGEIMNGKTINKNAPESHPLRRANCLVRAAYWSAWTALSGGFGACQISFESSALCGKYCADFLPEGSSTMSARRL